MSLVSSNQVPAAFSLVVRPGKFYSFIIYVRPWVCGGFGPWRSLI